MKMIKYKSIDVLIQKIDFLQIQIIQSHMKTRRQQQQEAAQKTISTPKQKKLTKAELMKRREQEAKQQKGKSVGVKKTKISLSVSVKKEVKETITKITIKTTKKEKQARVQVSPKGRAKRSVSKQSIKAQQQVKLKTKEPAKKKKGTKTQQSVTSKSQKIDAQKTDQQLPRKKPSTQKKTSPQKEMVKTLIMKGKAPIDDYFPLKKQDFHVLQYGGKVYSATLNQTNVMNNNNKFYILQILQSDTNANNCYFFTRWGRVGVQGQISNVGPNAPTMAINYYQSKLREKTRKGEYREVEMNYDDEEQKKDQQKKKDDTKVDKDLSSSNQQDQKKESKLSKPVQSLIQLIFDLNMMNQQMFKIGYNVNKMPLGKLSKESIKRGYNVLKQLYDEIKGKNRKQEVVRLTNDFYSFIPHDFGFTKMSVHILDTEPKVKAKIEMLESLAEIKVATSLINQSKNNDLNRLDANYAKLNREIKSVDRQSTEFKTINDYLHTTHGRHHSTYTLDLVDLFRMESQMEGVRYTKDIHNKMLLWHGSRLTNFVGILSQGLRIAPPEAPVTGYMFGKGVYFADMSSKSANYCFTSRDNNTGILLLCEVALGNMNQKTHADYYAANLPDNKHSTKGIGKIQPDPKNAVRLQKDVEIPMGPGIQSTDGSIYLRYNEFIVYDIAQVKIKYLLRLKFNYQAGYGGIGF